MTIFEAIHKMRELTKQGQSFSFSYLSYSHATGKSNGIKEVRNATLLMRENIKHNQYAEHQERYIDRDTNEPRRFWHPLLLSFNGHTLTTS